MTIKTIIGADGSITTTDDGSEGGPATETVVKGDGSLVTAGDGADHVGSIGHPIAPPPRGDRDFDFGSFVAGLFVAALIALCLKVVRTRERRTQSRAAAGGVPDADRMAGEVAALARRTAALETIVTDPGHRTAREIDALR